MIRVVIAEERTLIREALANLLQQGSMEIVGTTGSLNIPNPFKPGLKNEVYLTRDDKIKKINPAVECIKIK